ncbi:MAG: DNA alkylation repair protein [Chloroflexi bacterium]|nr:DNA alkylation repair protein [Chloroflexota bacterium]
MPATLTAAEFLKKLKTLRSPVVAKSHAHLVNDNDDSILGVRMGQVFALAREFMNMELDVVEEMLENPIHEMRVGAVSIMDFQARSTKTTEARRKELFDLYIKRHDRINTWDLVDRSAPWVVGSYLFDKPRKVLYKLARSKKMPERRTAIVSTLFFTSKGDVDDSFKLAEVLLHDKEDLIHKANGWALRFAGDKDRKQLLKFLDKHAADMPRVTLRYAMEHFDKKLRDHYLSLKDRNRSEDEHLF